MRDTLAAGGWEVEWDEHGCGHRVPRPTQQALGEWLGRMAEHLTQR